MDSFGFHDGSIYNFLPRRRMMDFRYDYARSLQMHSSLIRRLSLEKELEGHQGRVNSIAWNSCGSLLISGSNDSRVNIWEYSGRKLLHSIDTGQFANIFSTKFIPATFDELVVSGGGDEVRVFNLSRLADRRPGENSTTPTAMFQCHTNRVEAGNPNVVWSASEDGTLRQHDLREGTSCLPAGSPHQECRSILLDLRDGSKKSLAEPPRHRLALRSCDISTTMPHLLLVGGSDPFARLYDRRMLPQLSSCRTRTLPPCVDYFCPVHLAAHGISSLHLTHVTFSPNGEEVLVSYRGEHVYLFNVINAHGSAVQYTPGDAAKLYRFDPILDGLEPDQPVLNVLENGLPVKTNVATMNEKCKKLFQIAENCLKEESNYFDGVEACNEVLDGHAHAIGNDLRHEFLCLRAGLLLERKWKSDVHMAIRDCYSARKINSASFRSLFYMAKALLELGKLREALEFANAAQNVEPYNFDLAEFIQYIKVRLAAGEYSDFERHNVEPDVHASSNLSLHQRIDLAREPGDTNHSLGSSSSSSQYDNVSCQPGAAIDMKQRFVGHYNVAFDIKQASFLGQKGEFVASGSDDGRWFIWEKRTGRLIKMLLGDKAAVNCVQCHPFDSAVATSGFDDTVKVWTPTASLPSTMAGGATAFGPSNMLEVILESNQHELKNAALPVGAYLPLFWTYTPLNWGENEVNRCLIAIRRR